MIDVNPDWSGFFRHFLGNILKMIYSIGDFCSEAFVVMQSYTVEDILDEIISDGLVGDIIDFILDIFISDWFMDMLLWEFLLFGGIVVAVFLNIIKLIK